MTENKRFHFDYVLGDTGLIDEQATEVKWFIENCCSASDLKKNWITVCNKLNELADENEQLKSRIEHLERKMQRERNSTQKQYAKWEKEAETKIKELSEENEQLKKELHLMHMKAMFSTVQSFKGDVSKRYRYSKETDTIYDTANHYGQHDKILDKSEIVMLLNEYETVLSELKGDVE